MLGRVGRFPLGGEGGKTKSSAFVQPLVTQAPAATAEVPCGTTWRLHNKAGFALDKVPGPLPRRRTLRKSLRPLSVPQILKPTQPPHTITQPSAKPGTTRAGRRRVPRCFGPSAAMVDRDFEAEVSKQAEGRGSGNKGCRRHALCLLSCELTSLRG